MPRIRQRGSPSGWQLIQTISRRRAELRSRFRGATLDELEESCVPSYVHPNLLAAGTAWWRLVAAARLYRDHAQLGPVLDFGAATGEIACFLGAATEYDFVEADDRLASALREMNPRARRLTLETIEPGRYAAVFALDSLEHNADVRPLLTALARALRPDGVLVLSGPTENWLYRLGRRVAGFSGHYHRTTIQEIEALAGDLLALALRRRVPLHLPLFHVSVWRRIP